VTAEETFPADLAIATCRIMDAAGVPPEASEEAILAVAYVLRHLAHRHDGARELVAECGNRIEPDGHRCVGQLRYRWGMTEAACDACGARCGIAVAEWLTVQLPDPTR
jgi:hypothetical protein